MPATFYQDLARCVFIFIPGVMLMTLTFAIIVDYYRIYREGLAMEKDTGLQHIGLLPKHVWTIGTSYILLVVFVLISVVFRFREESIHWGRMAVGGVALWLGVWSLTLISGFQQRRLK